MRDGEGWRGVEGVGIECTLASIFSLHSRVIDHATCGEVASGGWGGVGSVKSVGSAKSVVMSVVVSGLL
jgi:hypothetical protein